MIMGLPAHLHLPGTLLPPALPLCPSLPHCLSLVPGRGKDKDIRKFHSRREEAFPIASLPFLLQALPPQPSDFPAFNKAILLNISKKYSHSLSLYL